MDICIAGYQNRVATLLETATELRLYTVENAEVVSSGMSPMPVAGPHTLPTYLKSLGVEVVICGGLARAAEDGFEAMGIQIIPWVKGPIETVLDAHLQGNIDQMIMPGRGKKAR